MDNIKIEINSKEDMRGLIELYCKAHGINLTDKKYECWIESSGSKKNRYS